MMIDFFEFIAGRKKPVLPDPATMLARLGITPDVLHEIEILRMTKKMKKADAQGKMRHSAAARIVGMPQSAPNPLGKRSPS
jgi:hypothetical protein